MPVLTLITEQCLAPVPGGTGRYTREVGRALTHSVPPDWQLRGVSAWHRDIAAARISGVAGPRRLPLPRRALTLAWEHGMPPIVAGDVIHATTPLAPVSGRLRHGRLVVTVHDAVPYLLPTLLTARGAAWHRRMIEAAFREADAIVVPTQAVAAELVAHAPATPRRLEVIGEGVSEAFLRTASGARICAVRARYGLSGPYLVTVGTLEPRKGIATAVRALARLPQEVGLAVVGPAGWGESGIVADDRVRLLGRVPDADLAALVAGAVASVHASRSEGFGLPLVEAMAVGTPVVHSAIPVFAEVAGDAGWSFPVDDDAALAAAVTEVLAGGASHEAAVARGREVSARHRWSYAAEALWALYEDLAAAGS